MLLSLERQSYSHNTPKKPKLRQSLLTHIADNRNRRLDGAGFELRPRLKRAESDNKARRRTDIPKKELKKKKRTHELNKQTNEAKLRKRAGDTGQMTRAEGHSSRANIMSSSRMTFSGSSSMTVAAGALPNGPFTSQSDDCDRGSCQPCRGT